MPLVTRRTTSTAKAKRYSRLAGFLTKWTIPEREKRQFNELCNSLETYLEQDQIDEVREAYGVGAKAHEGQRRLAGEKYINHPLSVARLLADLHFDSPTIVAAILHDTLEDTDLTRKDLSRNFGEDVALLVEGVSKVSHLEFDSPEHAEAVNLRRMFLAMSNDIRVIFIKLADRLHNLESLYVHRLEKKERIVRQTQDIYIPIANLLGMQNWQREMQDLCFKAIYPRRYNTIQTAIRKEYKGKIEETINKHVASIKSMLEKQGIESQVTGRFKSLSAIHEKMRRKGNSLKAVQDMLALRVVVNAIDDCYRTLGVIHQRYKPISGEFNDYIAIPKRNGYQSLHTTVNTDFGQAIEVQIRTGEMHRIAETGIASHLKYKRGMKTNHHSGFPNAEWLAELLHSLEDDEVPGDYIEHLKLSLFSDDVYVFTRDNEIKRLRKGATVIDFAYSIHTEVGNKARSATVNNQRVPFHTVLSNGDRVEIKKREFSTPDPDWLQFVATSRARIGIRNALKVKEVSEMVKMGDRLLKKALKKNKVKYSRVTEEIKQGMVEKLQVHSWSEILHDICNGHRMAPVVVNQMFPELLTDSGMQPMDDTAVSIQGTEGLAVNYAKCCSPIPPEPIIGFFSLGRGIVVHTEDCKNVQNIKHRGHWSKFQWTGNPVGPFRVSIRVDAINKRGVLASITSRIATEQANISGCELDVTDKANATLDFEIEVNDSLHLDAIMRRVQRDPSVFRLYRIKKS